LAIHQGVAPGAGGLSVMIAISPGVCIFIISRQLDFMIDKNLGFSIRTQSCVGRFVQKKLTLYQIFYRI